MLFRKCEAAFLIVALSHYFLGCAIYSQVEERNLANMVGGIGKILSVTLSSGEVEEFDENGGQVIHIGDGITGTTLEGKVISIPILDIKEMKTLFGAEALSYHDLLKDTTRKISNLILKSGTKVIFSESGGHYCRNLYLITGMTTNHRYIKIQSSDAILINIERLDGLKSLFASTGLIMAGILVLVVILFVISGTGPSWSKGKKAETFSGKKEFMSYFGTGSSSNESFIEDRRGRS